MKKRKKLLAIHSNKIFFKEDAPNFYEWICGRRGLNEPYQTLKKEYGNGEKGPWVLEETFDLAITGLTPIEFGRYIKEYTGQYQLKETTEMLKKLSKKFKVMIFSSFPKSLFHNFLNIAYKIFGSEYILRHGKIDKLRLTRLTLGEETEEEKNKAKHLPPFVRPLRKPKNHEKICRELDNTGLKEVYDRGSIEMGNTSDYIDYINNCWWLYIEPDRYGMLVYFIDQMIEGGYDKKNVIVLGKGETAKPMHKVAGKVIESLEELN